MYVGVYVCTTGVGGRKKSAFRISNISSSLRGTKIKHQKHKKYPELALHRDEYIRKPDFRPIFQIKISELKRLKANNHIITTIQD